MKLWRNGSASDSRPEGWGFESLFGHFLCVVCEGVSTNRRHAAGRDADRG